MKFYLLISMGVAFAFGLNLEKYQVEYPTENQVLFRNKGILANTLTFTHIRFRVNLTKPLKELDDMIWKVKQAYKTEMDHYNEFLPLEGGDDEVDRLFAKDEKGVLFQKGKLDGAYMLLHILDTFTRYKKDLRNLLSAVPTDYAEVQKDQFLHRKTKREILGAIALGAATVNAFRISSLEKHFEAMSSQHNTLVDAVTLLNEKHSQLAVDVQIILRLSQVMESHRKVFSTAMTLIDRLRGTMDDVVSIITSAQRRRVSVRLINGESLDKLYRTMKIRAKVSGLEMLVEKPSDIFDLESSFAYEPDTFDFCIYIHFPLLHPKEKLKLYEYIPFPLLESLTLNATIVPDVKESKYLGIIPLKGGPDKTGIPKHKFRILSEAELQSCSRFRDYYLCGNRNTLRSDVQSSCISALWLQSFKLISKNCDMKIEPIREFAAKISPNKWLVMSPEPFLGTVTCGNEALKPTYFSNQTLISLPENCEIELVSNFLSTDLNLMVDFEIERFSWSYSSSVFDGIIEGKTDVRSVVREIIKTRSKYGIPDINHLKYNYTAPPDIIGSLWDSITNLSIFSGFSNIFSFAIYIVVAYIVYVAVSRGWVTKCLKFGRKSKPKATLVRPLRSSVRYRPPQRPRVRKQESFEVPPPYSSILMEEGRALKRDYPKLLPSAPSLEGGARSEDSISISIDEPCAILDPKGDPKDFVCIYHLPYSKEGCSGYYNTKK